MLIKYFGIRLTFREHCVVDAVISLDKKPYPHCLVLVGFRNGFKRDLQQQQCLFHNQTKLN